jgi:hypothetical protein
MKGNECVRSSSGGNGQPHTAKLHNKISDQGSYLRSTAYGPNTEMYSTEPSNNVRSLGVTLLLSFK